MAEPRRRIRFKSIAILEAVIILILTIALIWIAFIRGKDDAVPANAKSKGPDVRRRAVIEKEETFYQFDGKKILMHDGSYGEIFVPVYADVPACTLDLNKLTMRNGYAYYTENGEVSSVNGIDVSEFQGEIDWEQVKQAGIEFAIIRVGYRTYGGGVVTYDEQFRNNIEGALAQGIKVGAYFYSQATTASEAVDEADAIIDALKGYDITYPVVYDWELVSGDAARTDDVSVEALADCCVSFCERVKDSGYTPMVYQNTTTAMKKLDLPRVKDYDFWLAEYSDKPSYYYDYKIWQYTNSGKVPGIEGNVDLNICFAPYGGKK
ncbi:MULTISPECIES: glycoside hydrolase family 25 protein [Ruminococcus]|uniref:Lyzozyme M1 (1,4-beta-N-acetylmuramidase), GH25 family n=1 Tax=Ruminococcus flavefaciens TaxID=1265 RepID=A0A1M7JPI0_RUMFL|nr:MULTISPECIES: glycoside hydrolase family 25 protein [Ruminococcus]MCR4796473.1 glycoside hydrolase family 25 protein [Ruminococcus sp.]SHM54623.1 Lyzozyme M1 (1,4-beta-N-acetylmuramidase), GH25 family [Ruminococcus flavefaciens]